VRNGKGLELTVAADRALDIPQMRYKGVNLSYLCKVGMRAPQFYVEDGVRGFLKQFYAGFLTTCGITYAGAPCEDEGRSLGLHGPYSNIPAQEVSAFVEYEGDDAVIRLRGDVREACMFAENMLLSREITVETEKNVVRIKDTVENQSFRREPLMLVYHINFGYPMLDAGARIYTNARDVEARTPFAQQGLAQYDVMEEPEIDREEQCYFHTGMAKEGFAMLHNEKLGFAAIIRFDAVQFPLLCEWKCMRAGEYALGLEPTTSGVSSRKEARENGRLRFLEGGESDVFSFSVEITEDKELIARYQAMVR